jgi:hypothetical protein
VSEYEAEIERNVSQHGWHCVAVGGEADSIDFAYSVGFTETLGAPELIVFGLDFELMHGMLWAAFRQIEAGKAVRDGERWSGLLASADCILKPVDPTNIERQYFNSAIWYHGDPERNGLLQAFQIVWPGAEDGLFPWDADCDPLVRESQPPLYLAGAVRH